MTTAELEVRVEGEPGMIPAGTFLDVLRTTLELLDQLERAEHPGEARPGAWIIAELRNSSAAVALRRPDAPDLQTPVRLVEGVDWLRTRQELPPYFSSDTAGILAKIGGYARRPGVSGVTFSHVEAGGSRRSEQVSEAVVANARAATQDSEHALGSVTGLLDVINLRRGAHQISLYDEETRRAVRCRFPDELFPTLRDALGHRVRAFGTLTRNARGQMLRLDIDRVEPIPETITAPSVDELVGIAPWYTGEQSTDEYLRSIRGA